MKFRLKMIYCFYKPTCKAAVTIRKCNTHISLCNLHMDLWFKMQACPQTVMQECEIWRPLNDT